MNILLLDDDVSCLDGLVGALEPSGHHYEAFTVPEEAVKDYAKRSYDVVITDMRMPGMSGIEVLKKVLAIDEDAKVIIVTGYGDVDTAIAAVNNRAYAFFGKPLDISELMETLCKIEREGEEKRKRRLDQTCLSEELSRLRRAYEELQSLIKAGGASAG